MKLKLIKYMIRYQVEDSSIHIESRGKDKYCVIEGDRVYNTTNEWESEPRSTKRSKEFIRRTRYNWAEACIKVDEYFRSLP